MLEKLLDLVEGLFPVLVRGMEDRGEGSRVEAGGDLDDRFRGGGFRGEQAIQPGDEFFFRGGRRGPLATGFRDARPD
jgi:hypothetical protein